MKPTRAQRRIAEKQFVKFMELLDEEMQAAPECERAGIFRGVLGSFAAGFVDAGGSVEDLEKMMQRFPRELRPYLDG